VALVVGLALVPASFGESEELRAAIQLFDAQEYVAAQEALLKIDRATLTDSERAQLDELLKLLPEAIQGSEKARQMLADADQAYEAGRWGEADTLYQAALENRYAQPDVRTRATAQRERIAEKKKLAEAARPTGTLEETSVISATREEPAPPPAGGPPVAQT